MEIGPGSCTISLKNRRAKEHVVKFIRPLLQFQDKEQSSSQVFERTSTLAPYQAFAQNSRTYQIVKNLYLFVVKKFPNLQTEAIT